MDVCEPITPFRVAGSLQRFGSKYLMEDHQRFIQQERAPLQDVLPKTIMADSVRLSALELTTGLQAWRRLRQDRNLSVAKAWATIALTVEKLLVGP